MSRGACAVVSRSWVTDKATFLAALKRERPLSGEEHGTEVQLDLAPLLEAKGV